MTHFWAMGDLTTGDGALAFIAASAAWLAAGAAVGAVHFLTLRTSARMLATGSSLGAAFALHLVRFAVTAAALVLIARHGALPLLAATPGVLVARTVVLRATCRETDFESSPAPSWPEPARPFEAE